MAFPENDNNNNIYFVNLSLLYSPVNLACSLVTLFFFGVLLSVSFYLKVSYASHMTTNECLRRDNLLFT